MSNMLTLRAVANHLDQLLVDAVDPINLQFRDSHHVFRTLMARKRNWEACSGLDSIVRRAVDKARHARCYVDASSRLKHFLFAIAAASPRTTDCLPLSTPRSIGAIPQLVGAICYPLKGCRHLSRTSRSFPWSNMPCALQGVTVRARI